MTGRVTGLAPGLGTSSFRTLGSSSATVTVVGTSLSAPIGSEGSFSLSGVPSGDVTLQFTASGTDARVTVSSVVESEQIQLTVSVSGATAVVVKIQRATSDNRTELEGTVTALTGACPALRFIVNGTAVTSDASTEFSERPCSAVADGVKVHVKGTRQASGSVLASKISAPHSETEIAGTVSILSGVCPTVTFTVNGTTVLSNAATEFNVNSCSSLKAGAKVEVKGTRQPNGSVLALNVNVEVETIEVEGKVSAASGSCPALTFTADGTTVVTNTSTQFTGAGCSAVGIGANVAVKGTRQPSGSVLALEVNVEVETIEVEGKVSAASGSCPALTFTASGTTVLTNASTQFTGAGCSAVGIGAKVEVKGARQPNGSVLALKVQVEAEAIEIEGKVGSIAGTCPGLTFSVNGTSITAGAATQYKGGGCGSIKVGTKVGVKGTRQAAGSVLASRVEIGD